MGSRVAGLFSDRLGETYSGGDGVRGYFCQLPSRTHKRAAATMQASTRAPSCRQPELVSYVRGLLVSGVLEGVCCVLFMTDNPGRWGPSEVVDRALTQGDLVAMHEVDS